MQNRFASQNVKNNIFYMERVEVILPLLPSFLAQLLRCLSGHWIQCRLFPDLQYSIAKKQNQRRI